MRTTICVSLVLCGAVTVVAASLVAQTGYKTVISGRSICVPFDPATLKLSVVEQTDTWRLQRDDGAILKVFADREDAEAGLAVAKQHTQLCYIGKSNTRADREKYIMEYWK